MSCGVCAGIPHMIKVGLSRLGVYELPLLTWPGVGFVVCLPTMRCVALCVALCAQDTELDDKTYKWHVFQPLGL